jgi:PelA/Pel-15E family pectate lyase
MSNPLLRGLLPLTLFGLAACQSTDGPTAYNPEGVDADVEAWADYLARSDEWRLVDRDFIDAELEAIGLHKQTLPRRTNRFGFDINQPAAWYATPEGQRVADIILSFQTPSGGWSKRTDMAHEPRQPGQAFGSEPRYVATFDNDATTVQMRVLARAFEATGKPEYANAFLRGVNLIIDAQYPNGCWPQIYPLAGGYHDHITFNDEAIENNLHMLLQVVEGQGEYRFVPADVRRAAQVALNAGFECVVNTQVVVDGKRTIWGAQYDRYTLELAWARAYEMPALATGESASLVRFLMTLDNPSEKIVEAVHAAVSWFEENKIYGLVWDTTRRITYEDPEAGPIWARFIEADTGRPIFGDRDGSIYYDVMQVSEERRRGYAWYNVHPLPVLERYSDWSQRFPDHNQRL